MKKIFLLIISLVYLLAVDVALVQNPQTESNITSSINKFDNKVFGANLFLGEFANIKQIKFNPNYRINIGDKIQVMFWGAYNQTLVLDVDSQGNIFIPQVGVVHVLGIEASKLNQIIQNAVKKVFKKSVFVYANVLNYQPISVFVTGSVNKPGLYEGLSSDSIIQYLDKARGINLKDGSFRFIYIKRGNKIVKNIDLYNFLTNGNLDLFQFRNGDVIYVDSLKYYVYVSGDVKRPYRFELKKPFTTLKEIKKLSVPNTTATNVIVNHSKDGKVVSHNLSVNNDNYKIYNGDEIEFTSDVNVKFIKVQIDGDIYGKHILVVKKGTSLKDVLDKIQYSPIANKKAVQLYRKSIAKLQKQLIESQLKDLEAKVFTSSSVTTAGATIKKEEAELILDFIKRARSIQPKGRVVLNKETNLSKVILENEDTVYIPKKSSVVTIQGEVKIPSAQTYVKNYSIKDYIKSVGGFTERADKEHILIIRQNGKVITYNIEDANGWFSKKINIYPGDSILVLGKPSTENLQITKDITQIIYQIAVSAGVLIRLF